jgi:hypothetical protein
MKNILDLLVTTFDKGRPIVTAETRVRNKLRGIYIYNTVKTCFYYQLDAQFVYSVIYVLH